MYSIRFIVSNAHLRETGHLYLGMNKFPLSQQIPGKLIITFYILDAVLEETSGFETGKEEIW